jgi:hypothetical protein
MALRVIPGIIGAQAAEALAEHHAALDSARLPAVDDGPWRVIVTGHSAVRLATVEQARQQLNAYQRAIEFGPTRGTEIAAYHLTDGEWVQEKTVCHEGLGSWGVWRRPDTALV